MLASCVGIGIEANLLDLETHIVSSNQSEIP